MLIVAIIKDNVIGQEDGVILLGDECTDVVLGDNGEMPMEGDMPVVDEGFAGNSPGAQMVSTDLEDVEKVEAETEGFVQNAMPQMNNAMPELPAAEAVEGFTGGMYAGF